MMPLKLGKTSKGEDAMHTANSEGVLHGALVLRQLVKPWKRSQRVVCADSYFASVFATDYLRSIGLRFIGVVKTDTRRYPMKGLAAVELQNRGDRKGVLFLMTRTFHSILPLCEWIATEDILSRPDHLWHRVVRAVGSAGDRWRTLEHALNLSA